MLTAAELQELDSTLLPSLERHHLRLLAHGLRTLQAIAPAAGSPTPGPAQIRDWALQQPVIAEDIGFADAFTAQLCSVVEQLQAIAGPERQPLSLELSELIAWARHQADQRISAPPGEGATATSPERIRM